MHFIPTLSVRVTINNYYRFIDETGLKNIIYYNPCASE